MHLYTRISHPLPLSVIIFICCSINFVSGIPRRNNAETRCLDRDQRALLQFKQALVDDYSLLRSWQDGRDCCHWRGVGCNNGTGEVVRLDLSGIWSEELDQILGLSGEIDSSLLLLRSLRYLDLSGNSFTRIPDFIGSLTKLQHLKLAQIEFGSPKVPDQLGNLSDLQTLDLASSSVFIKNTNWLTRFSSLKYLNLSYIDLSESLGLLNNAIRLPSLVELHLVNCLLPNTSNSFFRDPITNLSDGFVILDLNSNYLPASTIYPWLFNFSGSLTDINLSDNALLGTIPEALVTFKNLRNLDLTSNGLEGGIPTSFGNLGNLSSLLLAGNNLKQDLPSFFDNLSGPAYRSLQVLDLSENQLSGSLPDFTTFTALKELYLGDNQLNGSFPDKFEQSSKLSILDLADNRIKGVLPDLLAFASLKELYLERNLLNGTLAERLAPLSKLESLGASSNFFQGTISEMHISDLSRLKYLDLSYNSLDIKIGSNWSPNFQLDVISLSSCKLGNSFPEWLQTQKNFSVLDISNAGINDAVPSWFWASLIPGLRYLNLSSNQIHGMVPDLRFSGGVKPLIDMSSNNFSGNLPFFPVDTLALMLNDNMFSGPITSLCNLTILNRLDLSNNKLSGELPNCWNNFDRLVILNLENNGFTGTVPDSIGSLQVVDLLSMRGNSLTGKLPSSLRNCRSLRLLDLGENELSGKIPEWIGESLSMLLVLSLPSNRFNGTIPTSLCKIKEIQILDLSVNDISGSIPKCLNNISGMVMRENRSPDASIKYNAIGLERTRLTFRAIYVFKALLQWKGRQSEYQKTLGLVTSLDLSSNRLTGEIPGEITSLLALIALNLSRNTLTGPVPEDIGRLRRLDFLDLSRNDLIGGIPTSLSQLSNLGVLDLSFNNLSGRIPKSTQLQSFDVSSYTGNPTLCGVPLPDGCPGDHPSRGNEDVDEQESDDDKLTRNGFYVSIVVGFAFGFWGVCGPLVLKDSWRHAFCKFVNAVNDRVLVTLETSFARLRNQTMSNVH
ncbi:receptor-like protein EIX2 [Cynara cardunculus var. scolymus]|uniref:Leucine-rich repeat-containing protein n=1 Tax=Cynara cardunculus var. scolymus TaxID=59895 RepID=A0A124SAH9_CYNCS|nr:receptor-like protein EIX2 [Cynara cardunculus var. scolymus]KVH87552.1 Leucine-rich repeat-containing protein [Cynara cardunculus var. scolymus]